MIPIRTDSPLRHTPYMNWGLITANVLVFILQNVDPSITGHYELAPRDPRLITFITYAFLHGGFMHLAGNMLFLYIFGNNVNDKLGNIGFLGFYLAGAVLSGVFFVAVPDQVHPVVGASGAIAAVTGAYLVLFPRSNVTVLYFFYIIGLYELASIWFILIYFAYDLWANFSQADGVAHIAHIGGTIFGVCLCMLLLALHLLPRDQFDVVALLQRWNKRRQYRDLVTSGYNPFDYSARTDRNPPDAKAQRISELRAELSEARAAHQLDKAAALYLEVQSMDPTQVMARQTQLDISNHLFATEQYPAAAQAYELFLTHYPKYEQIEQVELVLGLMYARYLGRYDRAHDLLTHALDRLHGPRERELAESELSRVRQLLQSPGPLPGGAPGA